MDPIVGRFGTTEKLKGFSLKKIILNSGLCTPRKTQELTYIKLVGITVLQPQEK